MMEGLPVLIPLFFLTALAYSSVGFGGGSTYLALLVLFHIPTPQIPKIALVCNIVVVGGGLYHYVRTKNLNWKSVLPFVVASVPCAAWGGTIHLSKDLFLFLLATSLLAAGLRMLLARRLVAQPRQIGSGMAWTVGLSMGSVLGLLSGMIGIGGGIFLSPLLYFLGWGKPKEIAAAASFFIFVNSIAGLAGHWMKDPASPFFDGLLPLIAAVFLGGQIGSRWSVGKLSPIRLQQMTALLILVVATRIFWSFL